jgi:hypothetical protein
MASIHREITVNATARTVWEALADVGAVHTRLAPGFVADVRMDGDTRVVTFANGLVARELIVDIDPGARRLAYAVIDGRPRFHHASFQVFEAGDGCRIVWIADLLPAALAATIAAMMDQGLAAMRNRLEQGTENA